MKTTKVHLRLTGTRGNWSAARHHGLRDELATLLDTASTVHANTVAAGTAFARKSWKEWLQEDSNCGNRRAHSETKLPKEWTPSTATDSEGAITTDPHAVITEDWSKFRNL